MTSKTLTGYDAIEYAETNGVTLSKYADPTEDARDGLTVAEAKEVAAEDPSLIYWPVNNTHPEGCSCGSPECPEWQAAQA